MTKEEKQLLLIDLCGRLPYKLFVKGNFAQKNNSSAIYTIGGYYPIIDTEIYLNEAECWVKVESIKPYLRPMSSMTEEEEREFSIFIGKTEVYVQQIRLDADSMANPIIGGYKCVYWGLFDKCVDWLNKKMFDYRGLIPMGLALEAPDGMYKF